MKYSKYSVVIIGSGIAGLYAALKITQQQTLPDGLLLITKSKLGESNSRYAQGGIVGVLKEHEKDCTSHIADTIKAGAGLSDFNTVKFISENSDTVIKDLLSFGVEFDRNEKKELTFTLEAAHSVNRVLHSGGDATGRMIEKALQKKVEENPDIEIYEQTLAVDLLINADSECRGIIAYNDTIKEYETIHSSAVILASGGCGQLYRYTTNPQVATGDGIAIAYRAGAIIQDMEFIQFHPTALSLSDDSRFLISEAVRGEGAKLVDANGREFMQKYDKRKELAPRDVVTRAIFNEMKENKVDNVFLNATVIDKAKLQKRFPNISQICEERGIDISRQFIPVSPAAHYTMGGVKTNLEGRTSIRGLYAIGEVSSTGLHGANRLASNSLLECVVCAWELANYLSFTNLTAPKQIDETVKALIEKYSTDLDETTDFGVEWIRTGIQSIMWNFVGIVRSEYSLSKAKEKLENLKLQFTREDKCLNREEYEVRNMLTTALLIVNSALSREESRGAHFREDFPTKKDLGEHNQIMIGMKESVFVR